MTRFLLGDDLGNIKVVRYSRNLPQENVVQVKNVYRRPADKPKACVQALAVHPLSNTTLSAAAAFSDGSIVLSSLNDEDSLTTISEWTEPRLKENRFIGLALTESAVFSCTSNGALRRMPYNTEESATSVLGKPKLLPTRLFDWRLSANTQNFAYAGDEVDLSVWNTEIAFQPTEENDQPASITKKRKRNDALFTGEVWRAKNLPNDGLGLRQPVRITSLAFLSSSNSNQHLLTGTQLGDVRRYDTRTARRPVSDWTGIGKVGGVNHIEEGLNENEVFISDHGYNMFSLDIRNGTILYGYKGLAGAVTSIAPSSSIMASTSLDRYIRIHSVCPPATEAGQRLDRKGEVITKTYLKCTPTVISWDKSTQPTSKSDPKDTEAADEIWEGMDNASDSEEVPKSKRCNTVR